MSIERSGPTELVTGGPGRYVCLGIPGPVTARAIDRTECMYGSTRTHAGSTDPRPDGSSIGACRSFSRSVTVIGRVAVRLLRRPEPETSATGAGALGFRLQFRGMGSTSLTAAVERQAGACRQLAINLVEHAEHAPLLVSSERKLLHGYADSMAAIADGLIRALKDNDTSKLKTFWKWAGIAAGSISVAIVSGAAEGVAGTLVDATSIRQVADEILGHVETDQRLVDALRHPEMSLSNISQHDLERLASLATRSGFKLILERYDGIRAVKITSLYPMTEPYDFQMQREGFLSQVRDLGWHFDVLRRGTRSTDGLSVAWLVSEGKGH